MSRKHCVSLLVPLALLLHAAPAVAQASRQPVVPAGMSVSPTLTPGIRAGNMIFASGQLGLNRTAPDTTVGGQTRVALDATKKVFEAAGTTMANAVKCTVFLIDVKDFQGMNSSYTKFWSPENPPPARSTVVVAALVSAGAKLEIECIAAKP